MAAPTPTTPKRSRNTNISNSLVNPTKKDALCGYILYQSPLLNKGQFSQYTVQIQTDRDHSERMFGFNTKSYMQLKGFLDTGSSKKPGEQQHCFRQLLPMFSCNYIGGRFLYQFLPQRRNQTQVSLHNFDNCRFKKDGTQ